MGSGWVEFDDHSGLGKQMIESQKRKTQRPVREGTVAVVHTRHGGGVGQGSSRGGGERDVDGGRKEVWGGLEEEEVEHQACGGQVFHWVVLGLKHLLTTQVNTSVGT